MVRIIAWNVNSIRALIKKININDFLNNYKPDIFCMSETKLSCPDEEHISNLKDKINGFKYRYYSTCLIKQGYSGTAIYTNKKPINIIYGMNIKKHDLEGRIITLEFKNYFLLHVYTPNSGQALERLDYRTKEWDIDFKNFCNKLQKKKNLVICGDLNVVNLDIDIHNTKNKQKTAGFTPQERSNFKKILEENKLIDTFRYFYPDIIEKYTYWSYMKQARSKNKGWRIDYFLTNETFLKFIIKSEIIQKQIGSDHAPILLEIKI